MKILFTKYAPDGTKHFEFPVSQELTENSISEKKPRKTRTPKTPSINPLEDERLIFKIAKNTLNNKIKVLKNIKHYADPTVLGNFYNEADKQHFISVTKQVFLFYKSYFEDLLTVKNIPFYISKESCEPSTTNSGNMKIEYIIVNNTENIPVNVLDNNNFKIVSLVWKASKRIKPETTYYRDYENVLATKKIGLAMKGDYIKKSDVKSFTMKELTFNNFINTVFNNNNQLYINKIEDFKSLKNRVINNKIEEEKLKDFIVKNIIPIVPAHYLFGNSFNFNTENFSVNVGGKRNYRNIEILNIGISHDSLENQTIKVVFFENKTVRKSTAEEIITVINNVFNNINDLKILMFIYERAFLIN